MLQTSAQRDLDRTMVNLAMEEEARVRDVRRLEDERSQLQLDLHDMEDELKDYKVLLQEQQVAAELVYSVLDRVPQDSVGFTLEPEPNPEGFPVISKIDKFGSAAMSLEVHVGDVMMLVDGMSVHGRQIRDVVKSLEGPIGTHVIVQARHPDGDQEPYVVSLARGAQNHSLCISRSEDDDFVTNSLSAEDEKAVRSRSSYVMGMAEKALRYVCQMAYEHSQVPSKPNPDLHHVSAVCVCLRVCKTGCEPMIRSRTRGCYCRLKGCWPRTKA